MVVSDGNINIIVVTNIVVIISFIRNVSVVGGSGVRVVVIVAGIIVAVTVIVAIVVVKELCEWPVVV